MAKSRITKKDVPLPGMSWPSPDLPLRLVAAGFGVCAIASVFVHRLVSVLVGMAVAGIAGIPIGLLWSIIALNDARHIAQRCHDDHGLRLPAAFGLVHSRAVSVFGFLWILLLLVGMGLGILALAELRDVVPGLFAIGWRGTDKDVAFELTGGGFMVAFISLVYSLQWRVLKRWYDSLPG